MSSPLLKTAVPQAVMSHIHTASESCPVCDQPIPPDRSEEIRARIQARQSATTAEITSRLQEQAAREKAAAVEQTRREGAAALTAQVASAREEERRVAQVAANEKIAEAARTAQVRIQQAEAGKAAAEAAIQKVKEEANANAAVIREEAQKQAAAAVQEKLTGAEQAKTEATARAAAAEQQVQVLKETQDATVAQRVQEVREAMERSQTVAVNAEKSAAFEREQKLSNKVEELQRALANKPSDELGEGAELDLYEVLKAEFEIDRVTRINPGQPGADILYTVIHNGTEIGSIILDSKDHSSWRYEFVTKLAADQMAAKADHAILSTRKFPKGTRDLHVHDGVIIAAPARVAALVRIIRQHIVQTHTLRLSDEARTQKNAALYEFLTSQRCRELFVRIDTYTEDLLDLQVQAKKWHDNAWKNEGKLIRNVQKVGAEIWNEIETIIGMGGAKEHAANE